MPKNNLPNQIGSYIWLLLALLLSLLALDACGDNTPSTTTAPRSLNNSTATSQPQPATVTTAANATVQLQSSSTASTSTLDWKQVEQTMGKAGAMQAGGVYKFSFPRNDLQVTKNGLQLKAGFALGSHVEFLPMGNQVMVMGDLVLTEDEVGPVMLKLQQSGIEQSALHNHLLGETPKVLYMHIGANGDPVKLAGAIREALLLSKTPFTAPAASSSNDIPGVDTKQLDQTLGYTGKANGGIYQYSIARSEKVMDRGMEIPNSMGIGTAINFQPTEAGKAAITGDFALLASEVNPVIKVLRENGIEVTALHSHMLTAQPQLYYMHFFANDDASKLAKVLKAALDKTSTAK